MVVMSVKLASLLYTDTNIRVLGGGVVTSSRVADTVISPSGLVAAPPPCVVVDGTSLAGLLGTLLVLPANKETLSG